MQDITPPRKNQPKEPSWYLDKKEANTSQPAPANPQSPAIDPDFADLTTPAQDSSIGSEIHSRVQNILSQPMDRKKFLKTAGIAGVGALGLGQVLRILQDQGSHNGGVAQGPAYGSGVYEGKATVKRNA